MFAGRRACVCVFACAVESICTHTLSCSIHLGKHNCMTHVCAFSGERASRNVAASAARHTCADTSPSLRKMRRAQSGPKMASADRVRVAVIASCTRHADTMPRTTVMAVPQKLMSFPSQRPAHGMPLTQLPPSLHQQRAWRHICSQLGPLRMFTVTTCG